MSVYSALFPNATVDNKHTGRIFLKRLVKHVYEANSLIITVDLGETSLHAPSITIVFINFMVYICTTSSSFPGDHIITIIFRTIPEERY
jgi:hypothetical protein